MRWVERVATFCVEEWGLAPITGRVLVGVMICDHPSSPRGRSPRRSAPAARPWHKVVQRKLDSLSAFGDIAEDGFAIAGDSGPRTTRIKAAQESLTWLRDIAARNPPQR